MYSAFSRGTGLIFPPQSLQAACFNVLPSADQGCAARAQFPFPSPASFLTLGKSQGKVILILRFMRLILTLCDSLHVLKSVSLVNTDQLGLMPKPGTLDAL